jgi:hypothetical protein
LLHVEICRREEEEAEFIGTLMNNVSSKNDDKGQISLRISRTSGNENRFSH